MQPNFISKCDGSTLQPLWRDFAGLILLRCVLLWWRGENTSVLVVFPSGPSQDGVCTGKVSRQGSSWGGAIRMSSLRKNRKYKEMEPFSINTVDKNNILQLQFRFGSAVGQVLFVPAARLPLSQGLVRALTFSHRLPESQPLGLTILVHREPTGSSVCPGHCKVWRLGVLKRSSRRNLHMAWVENVEGLTLWQGKTFLKKVLNKTQGSGLHN